MNEHRKQVIWALSSKKHHKIPILVTKSKLTMPIVPWRYWNGIVKISMLPSGRAIDIDTISMARPLRGFHIVVNMTETKTWFCGLVKNAHCVIWCCHAFLVHKNRALGVPTVIKPCLSVIFCGDSHLSQSDIGEVPLQYRTTINLIRKSTFQIQYRSLWRHVI